MNPEHDDFTQLRRLLVLKRYEQPPPGYFTDFSSEVLARIQAGEQICDYSFFEALTWEAPWLQRIWAALETRPIYAGAFGLVVCGVLLTGVLLSENQDTTLIATPGAPVVVEPNPVETATAVPAVSPLEGAGFLRGQDALFPGQAEDSLFKRLTESQKAGAEKASAVLINAPNPR